MALNSNVLVLKVVSDEPDSPPSVSQMEVVSENAKQDQRANDFVLFKDSFFALLKNRNFVLLFISYGTIFSIFELFLLLR